MKNLSCLAFILLFTMFLEAQEYTPGWEGDDLIPSDQFLNPSAWVGNQSNISLGDSGRVITDTALHLKWHFGPGSRSKFVQRYLPLAASINLSDCDIFGITIRGKQGGSSVRNVELKFESGNRQVAYTWENLARLNRWCEKLVILKSQFSNFENMKWDSVTLISFAVNMNPMDLNDVQSDSGILSFYGLMGQSVQSIYLADAFEPLHAFNPAELQEIRIHAAQALMNRQNSTGLLTTWLPDGSSWLYGQGMALRILTEEGIWTNHQPSNDYALAAEKLARFLVTQQRAEGYWPRAWNASTGQVIVELEGDQTVWMGDFPWIPGSLAYYFMKSGDYQVFQAILKGKDFLNNLIEPSGKVNTRNMVSQQLSEVSNYEGYAAALYCLLELGDTVKAQKVMDYVMETGWSSHYHLWKEGPHSSRPVLLVNTWLASLASEMGYTQESVAALSMIGKLLYTRGCCDPYGFDGVGPIATWYEGTLSYIASGGPASNDLFSGIVPYILQDGTVPAYNENLGALAGIWAVDWSSLDATSWLYFAAAQQVPFGYHGANSGLFTAIAEDEPESSKFQVKYQQGQIFIRNNEPGNGSACVLDLFAINGIKMASYNLHADQPEWVITDLHRVGLQPEGLYLLRFTGENFCIRKKIVVY